jgi:hypothetical protein
MFRLSAAAVDMYEYLNGGTQGRAFQGSAKPFYLVMCGSGPSNKLAAEVIAFATETIFSSLAQGAIMKFQILLDWYHILRTHHQWTVFQAIRYALWLAR